MKIGSKTKVTREVTRQERNRRNNMKRITVSALVAFILFIALTIIQSSILNKEAKVAVYQVQKDISDGTKITEDTFNEYFATKEVQASLIPDGYITDSSLIIGKFVNRDYKARDIITEDGLNDSEALYNSNIKHPVKLSFSIGSLSDSVSGTIREGDYINIYGMRNGQNADGEVILATNDTYTFKHIYIERAYNSAGDVIDTTDKESEALMFTILIEEDDVSLFNEMVANCNLKLVKVMYDTDQDYKAFIGKETTNNKKNDNNTVVENNTNDIIEETGEINQTEQKAETDEATDEVSNALDELDALKNEIESKNESTETTDETEGAEGASDETETDASTSAEATE